MPFFLENFDQKIDPCFKPPGEANKQCVCVCLPIFLGLANCTKGKLCCLAL